MEYHHYDALAEHESFENSFDHTDMHHNLSGTPGHQEHLTGTQGIGGTLEHQELGHSNQLHIGLADILQMFQLDHTSHLFQILDEQINHISVPLEAHSLTYERTDNHVTQSQASSPLAHFQPGNPTCLIIGNPEADMALWYQQVHADTCAITSQGFILESLLGQHFSEEALLHEAQQNGWYTPGGTPTYHVGDLLEAHGVHVLHKEGASLADISAELQLQQKVLVGINAEDFWYHGSPNDPLALYPGIPGQHADHVVEVIGIDDTQQDHPFVIINDPGSADGRGVEVPADLFYQAWSTSGYYMVATTEQGQSPIEYGRATDIDGTHHKPQGFQSLFRPPTPLPRLASLRRSEQKTLADRRVFPGFSPCLL